MDARPAGLRQWSDRKAISQGAPQEARKQGGTPTRTAQTPECDGARERRGLTGRLPAPRSQRELEDPTLMGTSKVSSRDGATGSDSNTDRSRGGRKANSPIETAQKRLNSTGTSERDTSAQGRGNDHQALTIRRPSHKEERLMESQHQDRGRF